MTEPFLVSGHPGDLECLAPGLLVKLQVPRFVSACPQITFLKLEKLASLGPTFMLSMEKHLSDVGQQALLNHSLPHLCDLSYN